MARYRYRGVNAAGYVRDLRILAECRSADIASAATASERETLDAEYAANVADLQSSYDVPQDVLVADIRDAIVEADALARKAFLDDAAEYLRECVESELIPPCDEHAEDENDSPRCRKCAFYHDAANLVSRSRYLAPEPIPWVV